MPLRPPKGYQVVMRMEDFFEEIGWIRYMKAIRRGGMDYGDMVEYREEECVL